MKQALKRLLRRAVGTERLLWRITTLEQQVRQVQRELDIRRVATQAEPHQEDDPVENGDPADDYPVNVYPERIPWEIPVQLCLKDFIQPGDCALDVGANIGGISIAMSRLVGEHGQVHAFEANPRLVPRLKADLDANGTTNVTVQGKAVWCRTGEHLELHIDDSYYAAGSSLVLSIDAARKVTVETVSLDDYCQQHQLVPSVIKIDVEGAERFVLSGAERTIREHMPVFVFEYLASRAGEDPAAFLESLGYVLYDTNNYHRVNREYYLANFDSAPMANILAVPPAKAPRWSVVVSPPTEMETEAGGLRSKPFGLTEAGRYLIHVEFEGPDARTARLKVNSTDGTQLACYEAPIAHLRQHDCCNLVFEVEAPTGVTCGIEGDDLRGVALQRVEVSRVSTSLAGATEIPEGSSSEQSLREVA